MNKRAVCPNIITTQLCKNNELRTNGGTFILFIITSLKNFIFFFGIHKWYDNCVIKKKVYDLVEKFSLSEV